VPTKIPKDIDKLQDLINPVTITKRANDLIYNTNALYNEISKLMTTHTSIADSVYLARTHGDIVEQRRQAMINLTKHEAEEKEKKRQREEADAAAAALREYEDSIAAAMRASLEEAAGVKPKSRKRKSHKD